MITVIIPTCNRNDLLIKCLDKLHPQIQTTEESYEVIVSDDSKENIAAALITEKYKWVKWIEGPKKGPAANRNNGAAMAKGDWLVFIDDDCEPDKELIKGYLTGILIHKNCNAFEGKIYVDTLQSSFLQEAPLNYHGGLFWSCNVCIKKNVFIQLNGFDEQFPFASMEDVDLFKRLKEKKIHCKFLPTAAVMHPWRLNKNLFKTTQKRYQAHQYYLKKHPEEGNRMNSSYYFRAFLRQLYFNAKNAGKFRFTGLGEKICADFLQLRYAFNSLFASRFIKK